jgi:hypothetical protein
MIEKFYASHIMNVLDAAAINVMKPRPKAAKKPKSGTANLTVVSGAPEEIAAEA